METNDTQFVPIPVSAVLPGTQAVVDIYIFLANGQKRVLVFKAGAVIEPERHREYKEKGLRDFHVRSEDYARFMDRQIMVAGIMIEMPQLAADKKVAFLNTASDTVLQQIETLGFSGASFEAARSVSRSVVLLASADKSLLSLLERLNATSGSLLNHSMAVGLVSTMIGRALEWTRPETLEKLAVGGLLHDIGKNEIAPHLLKKKRSEMSYEELREYESHAYRGMQILQSIEVIPSDIVAMAYEHHETAIGQGYPRRLWDMKLNPLARVTALADAFCGLTMLSEINENPKEPQAAIDHIEKLMGQPFNKDAFRKLKLLVNATKGNKKSA